MIPNASELVRRRLTLVSVLRLLSLIPLYISFLAFTGWLVNGLIDGDFFDIRYYTFELVLTLSGFVFAVLAWFVLPHLAWVLVPKRRAVHCPFCDYRLEGLREPRCPECGNPLTPEFMGEPPAHQHWRDEPSAVRVARLRTVFAPICRLLGLIIATISAPAVCLFAVSVIDFNNEEYVSGLFYFGVLLLIAGFFVFFPNRVARFTVPDSVIGSAQPAKPAAPVSQETPATTGDPA